MTDFLLELRSEEIPARMQARAREDLARLFAAELARAGLTATEIVTYATPRRLALIARGLPAATAAASEETKGPKTSAPPQALDGFLRKTGLTRDQLVERDGVFFAVVEKPGRTTTAVLAEAIPAIIRAFPWSKSMRWGAASAVTDSLRWVRPLHGIVALFGEEIVPVAIAGVTSGAATLGHRFHHPGPITIGSANDYVEKLRACHVIVDQAEREQLIRTRAAALAAEAGLELIEDEGLVAENAGLTEWPVPLLGRFDPAFLDVPPEVIQLTARINQKYFVCQSSPFTGRGTVGEADGGGGPATGVGLGGEPPPSSLRDATSPSRGGLADAFICTANIDAADGGARIVEGNRKVLAARLADARFFYEQDLKVPLEEQAKKLDRIVFHEKLGTVADKVERVAKLARWLVEEGIILPGTGRGTAREASGGGGSPQAMQPVESPLHQPSAGPPPRAGEELEELADLAERAARLCKADLVTGMVGEFPELQGVMGGYYAAAQGEDPRVAAAIRDHYKPVGQGDEVPTAPLTMAVSLADKLDTIVAFFQAGMPPTGSKDPFALRRAAIGVISLIIQSGLRLELAAPIRFLGDFYASNLRRLQLATDAIANAGEARTDPSDYARLYENAQLAEALPIVDAAVEQLQRWVGAAQDVLDFFADRLKVQQREAGVRHDLIDAVFALGGEDDLVRLLARVRALQAFMATRDGANLLAGYKRAANILKKEGYDAVPLPLAGGARGGDVAPEAGTAPPPTPPASGRGEKSLSYTPEPAEDALTTALDAAAPRAAQAVQAEDFAGAMAALASLRAPIDRFFDEVTVNDPDPAKRAARLALLARIRDAVHTVADFSRIEG